MLDEVERKRAYHAITILIDAIEDPTTQNALRAMQHLLMAQEQRIDELYATDEEDE